MTRAALTSVVLTILATPAAAQPDEPTARDTAGAPAPGDESGRVDRIDEETSTARALGRVVLVIPRVIVGVVVLPIRGISYLYDRFQLGHRYYQLFFNDSRTMGVIPSARIDSGYGLTVGVRFVHRDLFGKKEGITAGVLSGGRYDQRYLVGLRSGERFGEHVSFGAAGEFEKRPQDAFYGIGNDALGVQTRHRQKLASIRAAADIKVAGDLYLRPGGALSRIDYGPSEKGTSIEMVYDTSTLNGFDTGVREIYGELEARWDSRRSGSKWEPPAVITHGSLAAAFLGRSHQDGMLSDYWRYGVDLQHFFRLGSAPRVLVARLKGEAVDGGDVPFTELPQLGGAYLLRGYNTDRFRDRVAAVGSLEYQWDLSRHLSAGLFVDVGRVYPGIDDLTFDGLRVGYGIGAQLHRSRDFVGRMTVASSKDGGVFVNLALEPVFEIQPRERQR